MSSQSEVSESVFPLAIFLFPKHTILDLIALKNLKVVFVLSASSQETLRDVIKEE
jgi:hypothetical protein